MNFTMTENMIEAMNLLAKGSSRSAKEAIEKAGLATKMLAVMKGSQPMRVAEMREKIGGYYTIQYLTGVLRQLIKAGAVVKVVDPNEKEFIEFHDNFGKMVPVVRFALR